MPQPLQQVFDSSGNAIVGRYRIPGSTEEVNVATVRDDYVYDSVGLASGTITANTKRDFFQGTTGVRGRQHFFNFSGNNKLPTKTAMLQIMRVGLYVQQAIGNTLITTDDACKLYCNAHVELKMDSNDRIYDGLGLGLQSGLGVWGSTGDTTSPIAANGTPSLISVPDINPAARWPIRDSNTLAGFVEWPNGTWFDDTNQAGASQYAAAIITVNAALTIFFRGPFATA